MSLIFGLVNELMNDQIKVEKNFSKVGYFSCCPLIYYLVTVYFLIRLFSEPCIHTFMKF